MAKYPYWDGKVHKRARVGDISIKGTAKGHGMSAKEPFQGREAEACLASSYCSGQTTTKTPDCRGRSALLALYWTLSSDGHPPESAGLREERPWTFVGAFVNPFGRGRSGLD
jgi:hypothetical protein